MQNENLVVLRTFSKAYSLAGVRLGYLMAQSPVIDELCKVRQPYSVDAISQAVGLSVYENRQLFQPRIDETIRQRELLFNQLKTLPELTVYPSSANYIMFRMEEADEVWQSLYERGVLIRDFSQSPGLSNCLRVTVGIEEENRRFYEALVQVIAERKQ